MMKLMKKREQLVRGSMPLIKTSTVMENIKKERKNIQGTSAGHAED